MFQSIIQELGIHDEDAFPTPQDKPKFGANLFVHKVVEYLIKKRRITEAQNLIAPYVIDEPVVACHVADIQLAVDKTKEAIVMLADNLAARPYLVPVLLKQI